MKRLSSLSNIFFWFGFVSLAIFITIQGLNNKLTTLTLCIKASEKHYLNQTYRYHRYTRLSLASHIDQKAIMKTNEKWSQFSQDPGNFQPIHDIHAYYQAIYKQLPTSHPKKQPLGLIIDDVAFAKSHYQATIALMIHTQSRFPYSLITKARPS